MTKPIETDYPIHDLLLNRWSPRAFSDRLVTSLEIRQLLEAARRAPSCYNEQPWRFIVCPKVRTDKFSELVACLFGGNRWASRAPLLMLTLACRYYRSSGKPNDYALHDVGLATAQLTMQASALGFGVHQMAGFDKLKARKIFEIPDEFEPVAILVIGYHGDPGSLTPELEERESEITSRRPQNEFVFSGRFGDVYHDE